MPQDDTTMSTVLEQLIESGPQAIMSVMTNLLNLAMKLEREQFLDARHYERTSARRGYANGYKAKRLDTSVGTLHLAVPKSAGSDEPFYPIALTRGRRSDRALMLAIAEMYVKGVSTRDVEDVMKKLGLESLSATQVSRAAQLLDADLDAWRARSLSVYSYLILDARYEKTREHGVADDAAVLSAIGIDRQGERHVLGVSIAVSEAQVHWRDFLQSLVDRGLSGVTYIVSDDHPGLRAATRAVLPAARWQRCQFHLSQNAIQHAPNLKWRKDIGPALRAVWTAPDLESAEAALKRLVADSRRSASKLSLWLERNVAEGLAVFKLPPEHRVQMRTSNLIERAIQRELKRRTRKICVFPNEASLERLVTAILVEIDEKWRNSQKTYINWNKTEA